MKPHVSNSQIQMYLFVYFISIHCEFLSKYYQEILNFEYVCIYTYMYIPNHIKQCVARYTKCFYL